MKTFFHFLLTFTLVVVTALLLFMIQPFSSWRILVVASDSMAPQLRKGGVVVTRKQVTYQVGDIVTYNSSGGYSEKFITHRIQLGLSDSDLVITKGDANPTHDAQPVATSAIVGKVYFFLPYVGYLIAFWQTPLGLTVCFIIPGSLLIWEEVKALCLKL